MKLITITLACLVVVCTAQSPPARPMISDSFCGEGEVEYHQVEVTNFGEFKMCRDQVTQKALLATKYKEDTGMELVESLLRYDLTPHHMAYFIKGKKGAEHCLFEERSNATLLNPFFDWVKQAVYEGQKEIREIKYDFWRLTVADVRFELAVSTDNPDVPVYYNKKETEGFVLFSFRSFNVTVPDQSVFAIPQICEEP